MSCAGPQLPSPAEDLQSQDMPSKHATTRSAIYIFCKAAVAPTAERVETWQLSTAVEHLERLLQMLVADP